MLFHVSSSSPSVADTTYFGMAFIRSANGSPARRATPRPWSATCGARTAAPRHRSSRRCTAADDVRSKNRCDQPPWAKPPSVSSSGPPGACTTPSRLMNSMITMRMASSFCSCGYRGVGVDDQGRGESSRPARPRPREGRPSDHTGGSRESSAEGAQRLEIEPRAVSCLIRREAPRPGTARVDDPLVGPHEHQPLRPGGEGQFARLSIWSSSSGKLRSSRRTVSRACCRRSSSVVCCCRTAPSSRFSGSCHSSSACASAR